MGPGERRLRDLDSFCLAAAAASSSCYTDKQRILHARRLYVPLHRLRQLLGLVVPVRRGLNIQLTRFLSRFYLIRVNSGLHVVYTVRN